MEESAAEYFIPQYSDAPCTVFSDAESLFGYLITHQDESYSVYFSHLVPRSDILNCMLFFTSDGNVIFGITVSHMNQQELMVHLNELLELVNGKAGYIAVEEPPPLTTKEFICIANEAALGKIR
jgi:hypothetical protein